MAIKPIDEKEEEKTALLRVTIPKKLLKDVRETKRICKEYGFSFDIKPDVREALESAVAEARKIVARARREMEEKGERKKEPEED